MTREIRGYKRTDTVPCGKCPECVKDKQNEFVIRSCEEQKKRQGSIWFFTLTYCNDTVPIAFDENGELNDESLVPRCQNPMKYRDASHMSYRAQSLFNLDKVKEEIEEENRYTYDDLLINGEELPTRVLSLRNKDISDWKKRVRRKIQYRDKRKLDFGYVISGEYGPRTRRPHYHGLLFGLSRDDAMLFKQDWEKHYGYTSFKEIKTIDVPRVARYVAKYVVKNDCLNDNLMINGYSQKPRKLTSVGFGRPDDERLATIKRDIYGDFPMEDVNNLEKLQNDDKEIVNKVINRILNNGFRYHLQNNNYKLPHYYRKLLFYTKIERQDCPTALYGLVQAALRTAVQKNFVHKCIEMANQYAMPESYETYVDVAKRVTMAEKMEREDRAKAIIERDKSAYCAGRF